MTRIIRRVLIVNLLLAIGLPRIASAQDVMLTLVSSITGAEISLTEADMLALPQHVINTENDNVDAMTAFEGPLGSDLLALVGTEGATTVMMTAINDYTAEIPIEDFDDYGVILALSADGEKFSRRDKGPLWVIYPMSEYDELHDPVYSGRQVWQLVRVEIK